MQWSCDVTLPIQRISPVCTASSDGGASQAARVIFFKVDGSCRLSGVLTEWPLCIVYATGAVGIAKLSLTSLPLSLRLPLFGLLNDVTEEKKRKSAEADGKTKTSQQRTVTLCLLHILWADPNNRVCSCAVTVICLNVESNKTVWRIDQSTDLLLF